MKEGLDEVQLSYVDRTRVFENTITRYFSPETYKQYGYMPFITSTENFIQLRQGQIQDLTYFIEQTKTNSYLFKWIDTSQMALFDTGHEYTDYKVGNTIRELLDNYGGRRILMKLSLVQSSKQIKVSWAVNSFDSIMGLVGGISSLMWTGVGWLLKAYQKFRFNNSIIGMIYPTTP